MTELGRIYWGRKVLRLAYSLVMLWLGVAVFLALLHRNDGSSPVPASVTEVFHGMLDAVLAAAALPAALLVVLFLMALVVRRRDVRRRDPVRRFSRQQRRDGMARAGGRCELEACFRRRCSRPAEHGDHFYPWAKGGSTSLQNFVAACAKCNRAKGARIPSPGQQKRLELRRREYLALEGYVSVGERRPLP